MGEAGSEEERSGADSVEDGEEGMNDGDAVCVWNLRNNFCLTACQLIFSCGNVALNQHNDNKTVQ